MQNGFVPSAGRVPPGGTTCGAPHAKWIVTNPALTTFST